MLTNDNSGAFISAPCTMLKQGKPPSTKGSTPVPTMNQFAPLSTDDADDSIAEKEKLIDHCYIHGAKADNIFPHATELLAKHKPNEVIIHVSTNNTQEEADDVFNTN